MRLHFSSWALIVCFLMGCGQEPPSPEQTAPNVELKSKAEAPASKGPKPPERIRLASTKTASLSEISRVSRDQSGALKALVKSPHAKASHRVLSLRKLETLNRDAAVDLSIDLAQAPKLEDSRESRLIRNNAVAALTRAEKAGHKRAHQALQDLSKDESLKSLIRVLRKRRDPMQKK